jgi:ABC-type phosphate transport system permease subunit
MSAGSELIPSRHDEHGRRRKYLGTAFAIVAGLATAVGVIALIVLIVDVAIDGLPRVTLEFLNSFASRVDSGSDHGDLVPDLNWRSDLP